MAMSERGHIPDIYDRLTPADIRNLALTIAGEIDSRTKYGGAPYGTPKSRQEIANILQTIDNRARDRGLTPSQTVRQRSQYSTWNDANAKRVARNNLAKFEPDILSAMNDYYTGTLKPSNTRIDHYYASKGASKINAPSWTSRLEPLAQSNQHLFLAPPVDTASLDASREMQTANARLGQRPTIPSPAIANTTGNAQISSGDFYANKGYAARPLPNQPSYTVAGRYDDPSFAESDRLIEDYRESERAKARTAQPAALQVAAQQANERLLSNANVSFPDQGFHNASPLLDSTGGAQMTAASPSQAPFNPNGTRIPMASTSGTQQQPSQASVSDLVRSAQRSQIGLRMPSVPGVAPTSVQTASIDPYRVSPIQAGQQRYSMQGVIPTPVSTIPIAGAPTIGRDYTYAPRVLGPLLNPNRTKDDFLGPLIAQAAQIYAQPRQAPVAPVPLPRQPVQQQRADPRNNAAVNAIANALLSNSGVRGGYTSGVNQDRRY